jgi:hypothetical protein
VPDWPPPVGRPAGADHDVTHLPRVVAPSAAAAAASRIVMGVTMTFMLLIMV